MSILSQKYKNYQFIQGTSEQGTSDDLISRQAVLDKLNEREWQELYLPIHFKENILNTLPSVRTGHWINDRNKNNVRCSVCGRGYKDVCATASITSYSYCPNCGCRMVKPQESEDKE